MQALSSHPEARFLSPAVLARIESLDLVARAVVEGFIAGLHRSPHLGFSTDFAEHRPYMPGDDIRHLDWKLLARTDRLYIKKYQGDTNAQVHLLMDASGSMGFGSGEVSKLRYAQFLAAALAYLGVGQHDAVGLTAFDQEVVEYLAPSSRLGHLRTAFGMLERLAPGRGTALVERLHALAEQMGRRSIVVLISDLYAEPGALLHAFDHLRFKGHDVIVFHVMDVQELEFGFDDALILEDSESGEQLHVIPEAMRDEYVRQVKAHIRAIGEGAQRRRVDYELLNTSAPLDGALFSYLARRSEFG